MESFFPSIIAWKRLTIQCDVNAVDLRAKIRLISKSFFALEAVGIVLYDEFVTHIGVTNDRMRDALAYII